MAKKKASSASYGEAKFPYAYQPKSLDRLLGTITEKPKPDVFNADLLRAWGFRNTNDRRNIIVLKTIGLLDPNGTPNQNYLDYKTIGKGPAVLGRLIKVTYEQLFKTVSDVKNHAELKSFFDSYGGGAEKVVALQIQTFKALTSHATFGASDPLEGDNDSGNSSGVGRSGDELPRPPKNDAAIRIDLHIHLPENKSKSDYESILESIAKHIYGKGA